MSPLSSIVMYIVKNLGFHSFRIFLEVGGCLISFQVTWVTSPFSKLKSALLFSNFPVRFLSGTLSQLLLSLETHSYWCNYGFIFSYFKNFSTMVVLEKKVATQKKLKAPCK